jgi:hypothetical protein
VNGQMIKDSHLESCAHFLYVKPPIREPPSIPKEAQTSSFFVRVQRVQAPLIDEATGRDVLPAL